MVFRKATLADKPLVDGYLQKYPTGFSKMTFAILYTWRNAKDFMFDEIDGHLVMRTPDYYFQPVGPDPASVMRKLRGRFLKVSEAVARQFSEAEEDRDHFDYVYSLEEMRELKGTKFDPKRNFINQFSKYTPQVCHLNDYTKEQFQTLRQEWAQDHLDNESIQRESVAVAEAIHSFKELGLHGICVRIEGKMVGFAIGEQLTEDTVVEHFEKGNKEYKGVYQFVLNAYAKSITNPKYIYMNRGQDIGLAGLRKAKLSYHPVQLLKKWKVELS